MFERLSDDARRVVVLAQQQARSLGHNYIGTEHLLLGVAAHGGAAGEVLSEAGADLDTLRRTVMEMLGSTDTGNPALVVDEDSAALRAVGIDLDAVRARVEEDFGRGALDRPLLVRGPHRGWLHRRRHGCRSPRGSSTHRPFAPRAKKSMEFALRESLAMGHSWVGPEHVLLGMIRVTDCLATSTLRRRGIPLEELRARVLARLEW